MQTLSDHILDIAQNSIRAQASRVEIELQENITKDSLVITIRDNGCGMDETTVAKVTDPFFTSRTVRKVAVELYRNCFVQANSFRMSLSLSC